MIRIIFRATICAALLCTSVAADVFDDCAHAAQSGDQELARRASERILFGDGIYVPEALSETVSECLYLAGETTVAYSRARNRFLDADRAAAENDRLDQREQRDAKNKQNAQEIAGTIREIREQQRTRELEVYARLGAACDALYKSDPNATITNKLCLEVFLKTGLPH